ncbi:MAG: PGPGW domain-containing protein [Coriobacteriia bacterium]|nr:PGPGW domain-containing protein [Coriobacteriia bacterium]
MANGDGKRHVLPERRSTLLILGVPLTIVGIPMLILPGPGLLVTGAGLACLGKAALKGKK